MIKKIALFGQQYKKDFFLGIGFLILSDICGLTIPWLIRYPIDLVKENGQDFLLLRYLYAIIGLALLQSIFRYFWRYNLYGLSLKIEYDLRNEYFAHLQTLPWDFFSKQKIGDIMSRATNDIKAVKEFFGFGALMLVDGTLSLAFSLSLMCFIDLKLTFFALIPLSIISFMVFFLKKEMRKKYKAVSEKLADISSTVREDVSGIRAIKAFVQEKNEKKRFFDLSKSYMHAHLDSAKITAIFTPLLLFSIGLAFAVTLWLGGEAVIEKKISLGSFVSFNGYLALLIWPMAALGLLVNITQKAKASFARIEEFMSISVKQHERNRPAIISKEEIFGDIVISQLQFCYNATSTQQRKDTFVLNIPNLTLKKGEIYFVVGGIGSGKSTLIKTVSNLFSNYSGKVMINGRCIQMLGGEVRKIIGYVDDQPFLFSGTIKENISFGMVKKNDKKLLNAVSIAQLPLDIANFPKNLDTYIGEKGISLSGGQKQRVAIARAVLSRPKILLLDDSFSSLDSHTEGQIIKNLRSDLNDSTIIIATHRLSIIKDSDMVVVLKHGEVIEKGNHRDLLGRKSYYNTLYALQTYGLEEG